MTNKCYSLDNESFNYNSLGEVFDDLESEGELYEGRVYYEADYRPLDVKDLTLSYAVGSLLDDLDENLYDVVGESADADFYNVPKEAKQELVDFLESWIAKHVDLSHYFKIVGKPRELKVVEEDLE